jgi:hypothetical protein
MKFKIIFLMCYFTSMGLCFAQTQYLRWAGGFTAQGAFSSDKMMARNGAGDLFVTGRFVNSADMNFSTGDSIISSLGGDDMFVAKYGQNGNFIWAFRLGSTGTDQGQSIAIDANGDIVVTGLFSGTVDFDPGAGVSNLTSLGSDAFMAKYNVSGSLIWAKGLSGGSSGNSIAVDGMGNIVLGGAFSSIVDFDPGAGTSNLTASGGTDLFIAKYTSLGNLVWAKGIGGASGDERAVSVALDSLNTIYATGNFSGTVDFDPGAGVSNLTSVGSKDVFVLKFNSSGNYSWAFRLGGTATFDNDNASSIAVNKQGSVMVSGVFNTGGLSVDFDPGPGTAMLSSGVFSNSRAVFLAGYTTNGTYVFATNLGQDGILSGGGALLAVDGTGDFYLTVGGMGDGDYDPGPGVAIFSSLGSYDIVMAKYTSSGGYLWGFRVGGSFIERPYGVIPDGIGGVYSFGNFASVMDFDPHPCLYELNGGGGNGNSYLARYSSCQAPIVIVDPPARSVCPGIGTNFSIVASGSCVSYQWQVNSGSGFGNLTNSGIYSGTTSATLAISGTSSGMNGYTYRCIASGLCGAPDTSSTGMLTVLALPVITVQPFTQVVCTGSNSMFVVNTNDPGATFRWQVNAGSGFVNIFDSVGLYSGTGNDTLIVLGPTASMHNYLFRTMVTGSNGCMTMSSNALLFISAPPLITMQPIRDTACVGSSAVFSLSGTGNSHQWQVDSGGVWVNLTNGSTYTGVTTSNMTVLSVGLGANGTSFRCVVSNSCPPAIISNVVNLTVLPNPVVNIQPVTNSFCISGNAMYTINASGSGISYQWQRFVSPGPFTNLSNGGAVSGVNSDTLRITNVGVSSNNHIFRCVMIGTGGCLINSGSAPLYVYSTPSIVSHPVDVTRCAGSSSSTFSINASAVSGLSFQWQIDSGGGFVNLSNLSPYSGALNTTLTLSGATVAMNGHQFRCVVGACTPTIMSFPATLFVNAAPAIVSQPARDTVCLGGNATFEVSATGAGLTYQWQANLGAGFVNLSNMPPYSGVNTAILNITGASSTLNSRPFRCVLSGTCSPVLNSAQAILTVQTINKTVTLNGQTLMATQSGAAYQWYDCATNLPILNAINQSFNPSVSGSYFVNMFLGGCVDSSVCLPVIITGLEAPPEYTAPALHPMPVGDVLYIQNQWDEGSKVWMKVYDLQGHMILSSEQSSETLMQLDLSELRNGAYVLELQNTKGTSRHKLSKVK